MAFRDRPDRLSLQAKEYGLMTSSQFLTVLSQKPLQPQLDSALYSSLNRLSPLLKKAAEDFKKRSTKDLELVYSHGISYGIVRRNFSTEQKYTFRIELLPYSPIKPFLPYRVFKMQDFGNFGGWIHVWTNWWYRPESQEPFRTKMPKFRKFCPDKKGWFREFLGSNILASHATSV